MNGSVPEPLELDVVDLVFETNTALGGVAPAGVDTDVEAGLRWPWTGRDFFTPSTAPVDGEVLEQGFEPVLPLAHEAGGVVLEHDPEPIVPLVHGGGVWHGGVLPLVHGGGVWHGGVLALVHGGGVWQGGVVEVEHGAGGGVDVVIVQPV